MFETIKNFIAKVRSIMVSEQTIKSLIGGNAELSADMIKAIELWQSVLSGAAPWLQNDVKSIGIEIGVISELANTCLAEMESEVSLPELDDPYQKAIRYIGEELQEALGLGSFIIKPLDADGAVEFVTADRFIPIRFDNTGTLTDVMFLDIRKVTDNKWYVRTERHTLVGGTLTIKNKAYSTSNLNTLKTVIPLDVEEDWAGLPEEVSYPGVERPDFGYFRVPKKNRIDGSRTGVSILSGAPLALIKDADEQYGRLVWEMVGGELAVHVDVTAQSHIGKLDAHSKRLYRMLPLEAGTNKDLFHVFSPQLRDQSLVAGLNEILRRIEFAIGLSYGDLSDVQDVAKTATEIQASKQRKYNLVKAIEDNLKDCLSDLVYAMAFYMGKTKSGYEYVCSFHDSILTDESEEARIMREDVAAGILRPERYLEKRYGATEETMADWIAGAQIDMPGSAED